MTMHCGGGHLCNCTQLLCKLLNTFVFLELTMAMRMRTTFRRSSCWSRTAVAQIYRAGPQISRQVRIGSKSNQIEVLQSWYARSGAAVARNSTKRIIGESIFPRAKLQACRAIAPNFPPVYTRADKVRVGNL
ncbi:unnamed protein product [Amoebophrya sp. A120]|nr:unnamed protein product [Amoebophrya sp. A120]|eukprot:GSA120T00011864001.1